LTAKISGHRDSVERLSHREVVGCRQGLLPVPSFGNSEIKLSPDHSRREPGHRRARPYSYTSAERRAPRSRRAGTRDKGRSATCHGRTRQNRIVAGESETDPCGTQSLGRTSLRRRHWRRAGGTSARYRGVGPAARGERSTKNQRQKYGFPLRCIHVVGFHPRSILNGCTTTQRPRTKNALKTENLYKSRRAFSRISAASPRRRVRSNARVRE
jgi:hypothetical protein